MELMEEAEGVVRNEVIVFPDNVQIVAVFDAMMTQWRESMSGVRGLIYEALPVVLRMKGVKGEDEEEVFDGIQIMERAALAKIREK